jgi:hypothetical protein
MIKTTISHMPKIILLGATLLISACTAPGLKISSFDPITLQPQGELGQLVIYRTNEDGIKIPSREIKIDEQTLTDGLKKTRCVLWGATLINLPAGKYEVEMDALYVEEIEVTVEANKRTFVKCWEDSGILAGGPHLDLIDPGTGALEVFQSEVMGLTGIFELEKDQK